MSLKSAYFTSQFSVNKQDVKEIKKSLDSLPGVTSVSVNGKVGNITVDYDSSAVDQSQISQKLSELNLSITEQAK